MALSKLWNKRKYICMVFKSLPQPLVKDAIETRRTNDFVGKGIPLFEILGIS